MNSYNELERVFRKFEDIKFPEGSENEILDNIHDDIAEYDGYVAGIITSILDGHNVDKSKLYFDNNLNDRLLEVINDSDTESAQKAIEYMKYMQELKALIEMAHS